VASFLPPDEDEEELLEADIDLEEFRVNTQHTIYDLILRWVQEASASVRSLAEARETLMDATVYGDYRSIKLAADSLGKTLEAAIEQLLAIAGQFDSPLQIKSALAERESGEKKSSPIVDALFKLDGTAREHLRVAFLTLLRDAQKLQDPVTVTVLPEPEKLGEQSTSVTDSATAAPDKKVNRRTSRSVRNRLRILRKKSSVKRSTPLYLRTLRKLSKRR